MEAFTKVGDQDFPKRNVDGGSNYQKGHSNHNSQLLKSKYLKRKENVIYSSQRRRKILFLSKVAKSFFFCLKKLHFLALQHKMRYWFPSYLSEILTVCSPTERSSWVLRAEPWKWKYANIYFSPNNRSEKVIWSWFPDQVFRHVILNSRFLFYDIFHVITLPFLLTDYTLPLYLLFSTFVRLFCVWRSSADSNHSFCRCIIVHSVPNKNILSHLLVFEQHIFKEVSQLISLYVLFLLYRSQNKFLGHALVLWVHHPDEVTLIVWVVDSDRAKLILGVNSDECVGTSVMRVWGLLLSSPTLIYLSCDVHTFGPP